MNDILRLVLTIAIATVCGCRTRPSGLALQDTLADRPLQGTILQSAQLPADAIRSLTASGQGWTLDVWWKPEALTRHVTWRKGEAGCSLTVPLRQRPRPWTSTSAGVTETKYGPYQPALNLRDGGDAWQVVMSHERIDFPSEQDLVRRLQWKYYNDPSKTALSSDGILVVLAVDISSAHMNSLGVDINTLTVNGKPPSAEILKPFLQGTIICHAEQCGIPSARAPSSQGVGGR